jgi:hypothetical protein
VTGEEIGEDVRDAMFHKAEHLRLKLEIVREKHYSNAILILDNMSTTKEMIHELADNHIAEEHKIMDEIICLETGTCWIEK